MNTWSRLADADPLAGTNVAALEKSPGLDGLMAELWETSGAALPLAREAGAWMETAPGEAPPTRLRPYRPVLRLGLAGVLVVALVTGALVTAQSGQRHPPSVAARFKTPFTTPVRAPRALARAWSASVSSDQNGWVLVGDIVPAGWKLHTVGPEPGYLTCASLDACYAVGDNAASSSGPADYDSLYFSGDGGLSWSVLSLPSGFTFTSGLACASPQLCYGAGMYENTPAFITTSDGAQQWSVRPMAKAIAILTCPMAAVCSGVTTGTPPSTDPATAGDWSQNSKVDFVHTDDGGLHWADHPLPEQDAVSALSCPEPLDCVVVGYSVDAPQGLDEYSAYSLTTEDGGASFTAGVLPPSFGFDYIGSISCADTQHCMALGLVTVDNVDQCVGNPPHPPSPLNSCSSGTRAMVSGIVTTSDGGRSWRVRPLPPDVPLPSLGSVSCFSDDGCWVSGEEAVPQGNNGGSAVILGTTDQGASWFKTTFTVPPGAPEDQGGDSYMSVGSMSCPSSRGCVALGASDQGSKATAVYSFRRPGPSPD